MLFLKGNIKMIKEREKELNIMEKIILHIGAIQFLKENIKMIKEKEKELNIMNK